MMIEKMAIFSQQIRQTQQIDKNLAQQIEDSFSKYL